MNSDEILKKWAPVLEHANLPKIRDSHRKSVTATLLENTEKAIAVESGQWTSLSEAAPINAMGASSSDASTGAIDTFDPVLVSLLRRSMPNLMAYDVVGVQPMTAPVQLIFAMRTRYTNQTGTENFYNEVDTGFSSLPTGNSTVNLPGGRNVGTLPGNSTVTSNLAQTNTYNYASGMTRGEAESLGTSGSPAFPEMAFSIEKVPVEAKTRALKAEYTMELAQDLKAVHGLDAERELTNLLSAEILAEINREVVRTINVTAVQGAQAETGTATLGIFDLDTDSSGRWSVEKFKGMMFHFEREANLIAKQTRRGKGNILICSSDVASALNAAGYLDYTPALTTDLQVDDTGNTFAGVLKGGMKVYIDPYAIGGNYATIGYKGTNAFDAGLFYCPYVPLQMVRAVNPASFVPAIGFKTRYGMVANPFAQGLTQGNGALVKDSNLYYRRILIQNIM